MKRLVLEGEELEEVDPEEAKEIHQRFSKRQLVSNADRYAEEEPQLDSDGTLAFRAINRIGMAVVDSETLGRRCFFRRGDQSTRGRSSRVSGKTTVVGFSAGAFWQCTRRTGGRRGRDRPFAGTYHFTAAACFTVEKGSRADDRMGRLVRTNEPRESRGRGEPRFVGGSYRKRETKSMMFFHPFRLFSDRFKGKV